MKDLILCIETSTEVCSVAVASGPNLLALESSTEAFQHASMITQLIDNCMKQLAPSIGLNNLSAIAISEGPGSFTGLRVGLSAAKGLCFALNVPLIAICTLKSLAAGAKLQNSTSEKALYCSMIDARRMEVYSAIYHDNLAEAKAPEAVILTKNSFANWMEKGQNLIFVGNGAHKLKQFQVFKSFKIVELACSAEYLVKLAHEKNATKEYSQVTNFSPKYLKSPNITKPRKVI